MKNAKWCVVSLCLLISLVILVMTPRVSPAEWFGGICSGATNTNHTVVYFSGDYWSIFGGGHSAATKRVDFDNSFGIGARGGYYFEQLPWAGVALDLCYFQAKANNAQFDVEYLSLLLMLRLPLFKNNDFPKGRLQPYAGMGLGPSFSHSEVDFRPSLDEKFSGDSLNVGFQLTGGISLQLFRALAIFGEYRFSHSDISCTNEEFGLLAGSTETLDTTLDTRHFLMGVSYSFF